MPDTDRDREAVIAFARAVQEAQARGEPQHPADREQEHLERSRSLPRQEQFETPDQRLERFRQKGLRSEAESPPADSRPADIELDDEGKSITPEEPLSWSNVGRRMQEYPAKALDIKPNPEKVARLSSAVDEARYQVDKRAIPALEGVKRVEQRYVGHGAWHLLEDAIKMRDEARHPKPRDITSYERHDANDDTVTRYNQEDIDRVKKAIAAAKAGGK